MNVVSVITAFMRPTPSEGDAPRNVPTNHESAPSQKATSRPQSPAPTPRESVKQGKEENPKVSEKDAAQQSSYRRQTADPKPWARYL
ncbi:MAG TPA: hypothetical protein VFX30_03250 [bacterium]|nr:hypothetical protein [bacterium]